MKNYESGRSRRVWSIEAVTPSSMSIILHKILSLGHLLLSNWGSISCSCSHDILRSPGDGLGPLLFLMYVNDLRDGLNSTVRLFADNALLYGTICCDEDAVDLARSILIRSLATKVEEGFPSFKVQDRVPHNQERSTKVGIHIPWRNSRRSRISPLSGSSVW